MDIDLTKQETKDWTEEQWLKWYETQFEEETPYSNLVLRDMKDNDLDTVLSLIESTDEILYENPFNLIQDQNILVAEKEDKIVGIRIYELNENVGYATLTMVHPQHRREGIGSALVDYFCQARIPFVTQVKPENSASYNMLKRLGYRDLGQQGTHILLGWGISEE